MIKGQLAATRTRLQWIMVNHGEELLDQAFDGTKESQQMGIHLWNLLLKLEIYREHVDKFTSAVRKKYGMKELKIRKDTNELRNQALAEIFTIQADIKDMTHEEQMKYLNEKISAPIKK